MKEMYTTAELATRWNVAKSTLEFWRATDTGPPYVKIGGQVRYRQPDILEYEREKTITPKED